MRADLPEAAEDSVAWAARLISAVPTHPQLSGVAVITLAERVPGQVWRLLRAGFAYLDLPLHAGVHAESTQAGAAWQCLCDNPACSAAGVLGSETTTLETHAVVAGQVRYATRARSGSRPGCPATATPATPTPTRPRGGPGDPALTAAPHQHHDYQEGARPVVTVTPTQPGVIPEAVLALYATLKRDEKADGSWNGGDTVQTVCAWFEQLGLDPEPSVHACQVCGASSCPATRTTTPRTGWALTC